MYMYDGYCPYITLVVMFVMLVLSAPFGPKDMNEEETGEKEGRVGRKEKRENGVEWWK
jgi:hypothetical protein